MIGVILTDGTVRIVKSIKDLIVLAADVTSA